MTTKRKQLHELFASRNQTIITQCPYKSAWNIHTRRETAVFNMLYEGLKKRNQKMFCNENHSKVTLIENGTDYLVIEGSANFTANPRIEQFVITNSKELYLFHKSWMDEIIK